MGLQLGDGAVANAVLRAEDAAQEVIVGEPPPGLGQLRGRRGIENAEPRGLGRRRRNDAAVRQLELPLIALAAGELLQRLVGRMLLEPSGPD